MGVLVVDACRGAKTAAACVPVDAAWETLTDHQFCCALRQWKSDPDRCDVEKGPCPPTRVGFDPTTEIRH
jgi:hypothetical protein